MRWRRRARLGIAAYCAVFLVLVLALRPAEQPADAAETSAASNADAQDLIFLAPNGAVVFRLHLRVDGRPFSELREGVARQLFETLDADSNGLLEGKELEGIPRPEVLAAVAKHARPQAPSVARSIKPVPKGRVTPDDLAAYLLSYDISNFGLDVDYGQKPVGEYSATVPRYGNQRPDNLEMNTLLTVLDADGDGRVTVVECGRVDELFRKLDLNDDETISQTEIAEVAGSKSAARKESSNPLGDMATLLQPMDRSGPQLDLARTLADRYRRMSRAQAALWLADSPLQFELDVSLPKKSLQSPSVALRTVAASGEQAGSGVRKGTAGEIVLELGRLPVELHAAESPPRPVSREAHAKALFKQADRDNSGYLDAGELATTNLGLGPDDFKAIDADHNGMLFEGEWLAFMAMYEIVAENRVTLTIGATSNELLTQFDANGDGRLTHGEWVRALATIQSWDANHDGEISAEEVPHRYVGTFHLGTLRPAANGRSMKDSKLSTTPANSAPPWFQKMDRNRDGEVSLREFLGPLSVFRRLDANRDGYLDADEARKSGE
jgi:Ca2+-binding EF-hand superfamily protein